MKGPGFRLAYLLAGSLQAGPAAASGVDDFLKSTFGIASVEDIAIPIFIALALVTAVFFWLASAAGKRRAAREIAEYNAKLADYSARLRKGKI